MTLREYLESKGKDGLLKSLVENGEQSLDNEYTGLKEQYLWACEQGHTWKSSLKKRMVGIGCPVCSGRLVIKGVNDFASKYPELLNEWDYEKNKDVSPDNISAGNGKTVWWKCQKGHSWQDTINHRSDGRGCPYCGNKKIIVGENDFATTHKNLLKEWDFEKNTVRPTEVVGGSSKKVWWKCNICGHSYKASLVNKTRFNARCPNCRGKKK